MADFLDILKGARVRLTTAFPYYGRVAFALQFVESKGLGTLAVDKYWRCYYDPDLITQDMGQGRPWTVEEITGVLAHECNHLLRIHLERLPVGINPMAWNLAGDAEINDDLGPHLKKYGQGVLLPDGLVLPSTFDPPCPDGLTAEEYLQHLQKHAKKDGDGIPLYDGNDCGSAAGGPSRDYEETPDPKNGKGVSDTQGDLIRRQVAKDVQDYKKATGTTAGELDRWADDLLNPTIDWRRALAAWIRQAVDYVKGDFDYSYTHPTFKKGWSFEPGEDWILPGFETPIPSIAVAIDTSGSMSGKELQKAVSEVKGICEALQGGAALRVYAVDAALHSSQQVFDAKQIKSLKGGGGTDMGVGIAQAEKDKVNICVVITDGYTPWPTTQPKCKVIVALMPNTPADNIPSWAKVVQITND